MVGGGPLLSSSLVRSAIAQCSASGRTQDVAALFASLDSDVQWRNDQGPPAAEAAALALLALCPHPSLVSSPASRDLQRRVGATAQLLGKYAPGW